MRFRSCELIVKDFQPLSVVENAGFLENSRALNPLYKVKTYPKIRFNKRTFKKPLYTRRIKFETLIGKSEIYLSNRHFWTSDRNVSYLSLTAHFVHENMLQSSVLSTKQLNSEHHTVLNIAKDIKTILTEFI